MEMPHNPPLHAQLNSPVKRPSPALEEQAAGQNGPAPKRIKSAPEEPAQYSDAVRKKLAATSRTGQACDRCKERKMKCDTDPSACGPCRQKGLRCFTTDRTTGTARERGQSERAENELAFLRDQLAAYQHRFGPLQRIDLNGGGAPEGNPAPPPAPPPPPPPPPPPAATTTANVTRDLPAPRPSSTPTTAIMVVNPAVTVPDSRYVGWPAPDNSESLHEGPVKRTVVNLMDGKVDIAAFECEMMQDYPRETKNKFNLSRTSILNTMMGIQQIDDPQLPSKEDTIQHVTHFLVIMYQYVPVVHGPTFLELARRLYDDPSSVLNAERVQVIMILAIIAQQTGVRNHQHSVEKFEESHRYFHYALSFYRALLHDRSLASMQALALIMTHFRNCPKPGVSWIYCHQILVRAIELEYHRDPDKLKLPPGEDDVLSKELRVRVFHSMLAICVTTGCRVGLPAPWQFQHLDIPLPKAIKHSEISKHGISSELSGQCDLWPCIHLAKLLPLLTELHNNVAAVRRSAEVYLQTVEALNTKITAWRQDWDDSIKNEPKSVGLQVASLLIETWAAEFTLNLHHPVCCTSDDLDVINRHLDICHKASKRLLQSFHILSSRYKGVDFTWHSTVAYATAFGITLYVYRKRKAPVSNDQFEAMKNELKGWISLMAYADLVLRTGNHLQRQFQPRVQALEEEYRPFVINQPQKQPAPTPAPTAFNTTNGIKTELSQQTTPVAKTYAEAAATTSQRAPPPLQAQNIWAPPPQPPTPSQAAAAIPGPQWPTPYSFSQTQNNSSYPSSVAQQMPAAIPTSLASLLNDNGNIYVNYPTPPQTQNQSGNTGDPMMNFSPSHYFDALGGTGWPYISMQPPGGQG